MKLNSWRLAKARYAAQPLDGSGARIFGGRWNSVGTAMVYTSSTAALAAMEVLAHLSAGTRIAFELIQFEFEDHLVKGVSLNALPSGWNRNSPPSSMTQRLGDHWVRAGSSAVFRVPSVHVPLGDSYLFNPLHPDFGRIEVVSQTNFSFDRRLTDSHQTM